MTQINLAFMILCATIFAEAAFKSQKTYDSQDHYAGPLHHGGEMSQSFLRPHGLHPDQRPVPFLDDTDVKFRNGHGDTNQKGTGEFECPDVCPMNLRPVCGSDGLSYSNECELKVTACKQRKRVYVEREGRC